MLASGETLLSLTAPAVGMSICPMDDSSELVCPLVLYMPFTVAGLATPFGVGSVSGPGAEIVPSRSSWVGWMLF